MSSSDTIIVSSMTSQQTGNVIESSSTPPAVPSLSVGLESRSKIFPAAIE